jgi:predicted dehydrogenase
MKLALCVLGCGQHARTFARAVDPLRDQVDLYFASRDLDRAGSYCRDLGGVDAFPSYQAAASDPRVDALYVCTPHHLHLEHVKLAAGRGKHVLVEKPVARSLEEADLIIAAARQSGITLMVAENLRFMSAVRKCKELTDGGAIGDLRLLQLQEEAPFRPGDWRSDREINGGGVFIDGGIHKVHFLRYLLGEPEQIYAAALPPGLPGHGGEDGLVMVARWSSGAVGLINHSWVASQRATPRWVSVSGTAGRIYFDVGGHWLRLERGDSHQVLNFAPDHWGITDMVREFRDSIRQGREPETSGSEGRRDLALVLQAYRSSEQGASLTLGQGRP